MRIIKLKNMRLTRAALDEAVAVLRAGGVVAFPTETAYGLAADPKNAAAVAKIFRIKGRAKDNQLPLVAASIDQMRATAFLRGRLKTLVEKHWPGPLTLVLPAKAGALVGDPTTVAVRVPGSALVRRMCEEFGAPVTATSANLSGHPALYSGAAVRREFALRRHQPDLLLDAGRIPMRPPSTIVTQESDHFKVLRKGPIRVRD
jgi:L-threonylcarbamoyladenylate synthase